MFASVSLYSNTRVKNLINNETQMTAILFYILLKRFFYTRGGAPRNGELIIPHALRDHDF